MNGAAKDGDARPLVAIVSGHLTPYRVHLHRRIASELTEARLATVVTKSRTHQWSAQEIPEIGTVLMETEPPPPGRGPRFLRHELGTARRLTRWLDEHRPAAVVCGGYDEVPTLAALRWARCRGVPAMLSADSNIHSDLARGLKRLVKNVYVRAVCSRYAAVLVFGSAGRAFFNRYGVPDARIHRMPFEPDYALVERMPGARVREIAARLGLTEGRRRVACVCRLIGAKRVDVVIDAFARLAAERPGWDLVIVGDGELRKDLEARAAALPPGRVTFTGVLDQEAVTAVYRSSDVLALASAYEPWGLVVNEAAAAGLAVVATDVVGAAPELVRPGVNGAVVRAGDADAFAAALREVTDPGAIDRLRAGSREVLTAWRRDADPVEGLRGALGACGVLR